MEHYPFELMPLHYEYNSLEPYIDEETMKLHHNKHLKTYVDNLNKALKDYPQYHNWSLEQILYNICSFPHSIQTQIKNNAGGVYNHNMYFSLLKKDVTIPESNFSAALLNKYCSFENFAQEFKEKALSVFGSGYAFLVINKNCQLEIITTKNQDTPLDLCLYPILLIDVWEHAYYLKYNNRRNEYIDNFFNVINWDLVSCYYDKYFQCDNDV